MRTIPVLMTLIIAAWTFPALHAATKHQHVHAHGKAELEMSVTDGAIRGIFRTPMDNLLGFEHSPKTETQKAAVERLRQRLGDASRLFRPDAAAQCRSIPANFSSAMFSNGPQSGHSDLEYRFGFDCKNPKELKSIEAVVFEDYPRLHEIRTEFASGTGQQAVTLKKNNRRFTIK